MKSVDGKLDKLEQVISDDFVWGSTRINPSCLTEAERMVDERSDQPIPDSVDDFQEHATLSEKSIFYRIRRAVDYFMSEVGLQIVSPMENRIFYYMFIDFLNKTMLAINRLHGTEILTEMTFGRNHQNWPASDDPRWKELDEMNKKWENDFKEYWEATNPSHTELVEKFEPYIEKKENEENEDDQFFLEINEVLGEIITNYLARPITFRTAYLVGLSASDKTKTLTKLLKEQTPKQKHIQITKTIIQLAK